MTKRNKLSKIIEGIDKVDEGYFKRSLYVDKNELKVLCENIINNNVKNVIEIGTYKGVASAVFSSIIDGTVYTINVNKKEVKLAKKLWGQLGINNIVQLTGSSLDELPKVVDIDDVNFVYVDGNHAIPYASKEYEIILNSNISNTKCLVYFDDGPLPGVMQAIEKYELNTLSGYEWMKLDEEKKNGAGTLRAYNTFNNFKVQW